LTDAIRLRPGHTGGNEHELLLWVLALMFAVLSAAAGEWVGVVVVGGTEVAAVVRRRWVWLWAVVVGATGVAPTCQAAIVVLVVVLGLAVGVLRRVLWRGLCWGST
jgi:hypothetical protein